MVILEYVLETGSEGLYPPRFDPSLYVVVKLAGSVAKMGQCILDVDLRNEISVTSMAWSRGHDNWNGNDCLMTFWIEMKHDHAF